ncbi:MFS transporter [Demequina litorisediminis]|uniref:MFS transporter n=2 Tax=Demequina litorisediminis TaxID=1849022 RepID=A0ABQ6IHB3_9MICO|nr:MFS transporter [Demequina litorisediminis]
MTESSPRVADATAEQNPWPALWALMIGFFMILVDVTIVSIANPSIQASLDASTTQVLWVTSAYLLTYAVPLLITGRLGDRFGPRRLYLIGLVVFTIASFACGIADQLPGSGIANLIAFRAVQGFGAAMMSPQTMAVITRLFPASRRGTAMALWGATAGVASLVGPLLGGFLVDGPGWEWIFFVNVPIGIVAYVMVARLVPALPTHAHEFDWWGVALSAVGMTLLVFGIQEGSSFDWNGWVWACIASGVIVIALFLWSQARHRGEPLLPLALFRDRNFSLANGAIALVGFAVTAQFIPIVYFLQTVRGLTPTESALMSVPTAVASIALSPVAGRLVDRLHPRVLAVPGLLLSGIGLVVYFFLMTPDVPVLWLLVPAALVGIGNSFMWGPISSTATRNLPPRDAGAGSGVYNTTRQVGSVLGSAAIATLMSSRLAAALGDGGAPAMSAEGSGALALPEPLLEPFSTAMAQSLLLPAAVLLVGAVIAAFFVLPDYMADKRTAPAS